MLLTKHGIYLWNKRRPNSSYKEDENTEINKHEYKINSHLLTHIVLTFKTLNTILY